MSYKELQEMAVGKVFPMIAENEDGNFVIIREGSCEGNHYYQTRTLQDNGWVRVNCYYEDGSIDETYER